MVFSMAVIFVKNVYGICRFRNRRRVNNDFNFRLNIKVRFLDMEQYKHKRTVYFNEKHIRRFDKKYNKIKNHSSKLFIRS